MDLMIILFPCTIDNNKVSLTNGFIHWQMNKNPYIYQTVLTVFLAFISIQTKLFYGYLRLSVIPLGIKYL